MANRKKRSAEKDAKFLEAIAAGMTVNQAAALINAGRSTVFQWRQDDEQFAQRWEDAVAQLVERMEIEADRRALEGVERPIFYKGEICGHVREFSDSLLITRLKALAPYRYRERQDVNLKATVSLERLVNTSLAIEDRGVTIEHEEAS